MRIVALGAIGDGADGLAADAVSRIVSEQIHVPIQIVFLRRHGLQQADRRPGVIDGAVAVDGLAAQVVCLNGIFQLPIRT